MSRAFPRRSWSETVAMFCAVCACGCTVSLASASPNSPFTCSADMPIAKAGEQLSGVEKRYAGIQDLSAEFTQFDTLAALETEKEAQGKVFFRKPGMMDWQYLTPKAERFISDGATLWYHQPDLNQVTLFEFQKSFSSDLPVSFLLGLGSIHENFELVRGCKGGDQQSILELRPKRPEEALEQFFLVTDSKSLPVAARIVKRGGNTTEIVLTERKFDAGLNAAQFAFTIPKGVLPIDKRGETSHSSRPVSEQSLISAGGEK